MLLYKDRQECPTRLVAQLQSWSVHWRQRLWSMIFTAWEKLQRPWLVLNLHTTKYYQLPYLQTKELLEIFWIYPFLVFEYCAVARLYLSPRGPWTWRNQDEKVQNRRFSHHNLTATAIFANLKVATHSAWSMGWQEYVYCISIFLL